MSSKSVPLNKNEKNNRHPLKISAVRLCLLSNFAITLIAQMMTSVKETESSIFELVRKPIPIIASAKGIILVLDNLEQRMTAKATHM